MTWFNQHQTKIERDQLIESLLTRKHISKNEKKQLRLIKKEDQSGIWHVMPDGRTYLTNYYAPEVIVITEPEKEPYTKKRQNKFVGLHAVGRLSTTSQTKNPKKLPLTTPKPGPSRGTAAYEMVNHFVRRARFFKMRRTGCRTVDSRLTSQKVIANNQSWEVTIV